MPLALFMSPQLRLIVCVKSSCCVVSCLCKAYWFNCLASTMRVCQLTAKSSLWSILKIRQYYIEFFYHRYCPLQCVWNVNAEGNLKFCLWGRYLVDYSPVPHYWWKYFHKLVFHSSRSYILGSQTNANVLMDNCVFFLLLRHYRDII